MTKMDPKAEAVQSMFGRLAARYDLANDLISVGQHRWWKARAIELAQIPPGGRALDLCTGTGDLAFWTASTLSFSGEVVGVDFCEPMLQQAILRAQRSRSGRGPAIHFVQARAEAMPLADNSFDACTVAFGLRNVSDLDTALGEIRRVLKPGARLVSLDVSTPDSPWYGPLYSLYFNRVLPLLGAAVNSTRADYSYLPNSALTFPQKREMCRRMLAAGFGSAGYYNLSGGAVAIHVAEKSI